MIHIGTDEAGYGPILGPLVVAAAVFRTSRSRTSLAQEGIEDSKKAYGRGGRRALAQALGPYLAGARPVRLTDVLERWSVSGDPRPPYPWYAQDVVDGTVGLGEPPRSFRRIYVDPICAGEFNEGCARQGDNKAALLSARTLRLIRRALLDFPDEEVRVVCDQHGGRRHYAGRLLLELAPARMLAVRENRAESCYRLEHEGREVVLHFRPKADAEDPACALASMAAKYVRELFMESLNRFFTARVEGLSKTAGYYSDGTRFFREIEVHLPGLGIDVSRLLRRP